MGHQALFESTYVPAAVAGRGTDPRAGRYARWTLSGRSQDEPASAALSAADKILRRGRLIPAPPALERSLAALLGLRLQAGLRAAHQIQLAALHYGAWSTAAADLGRLGVFSHGEAEAILRLALEDLSSLGRALSSLYPEAEREARPLFISFSGAARPGWDCLFIEEGGQGAPEPFLSAEPPPEVRAQPKALEALARRCFGVDALRPGQAEAVQALLEGRDVAALLPTGSGKSLIFQLAALLRPGVGVVVEPLLSIIEDQRRTLALQGITAVGAFGSPEATSLLSAGRLILAFASPERFEAEGFRAALRAAAEGAGVAFVAIDEAHCVSGWGHDFRPAFLSVGRRARRWAEGSCGEPPLAALTGTATRAQLGEAVSALGLRRPISVARSLARPELSFVVERCGAGEHIPRLRRWLSRHPGARFGPGLIFCGTVEGRLGAAAVHEELLWGENLEAGLFTGRAPVREDAAKWRETKARSARSFLDGRLDWLCCTSAFGLGVDVPRARFCVHLGLAGSLEGYFQEASRAGRDGANAVCRLLLHLYDESRARRWFSPAMPLGQAAAEHGRVPYARRDDAWAALARHLRSYPGAASEARDAALTLEILGPPRVGRVVLLASLGQAPGALARAASRLEAAGFVEVWRRLPHGLELLGLRDASIGEAREGACTVIDDVYSRVEPARRASLGRLLDLCLDENAPAALSAALARMGES